MIQLKIIKKISPKSTIFSFKVIFFEVRKRIPSTIDAVPQAMLGSASASLVAGGINVIKFVRIFFIALSTPSKSLVPPIFIANVDGKLLPDAFVFCKPKNAGKRKKAVKPIAISENTPV